MAIGVVIKYNQLESALMKAAGRQWDDATVGSNMFILADNTYTPAAIHTTTTQVTGIIAAGAGAPIPVASPAIDGTSAPGSTSFKSASANFGSAVSVTAKYLICIQPVTPGTFTGTNDKLLWYVDLDTSTTTASQSSTNAAFIINQPAAGWYDIT